MSQRERPAGQDGANATTTTRSTTSVADPADAPPQLVAKADRALRAALREGLHGPDVEQLLTWVAQHRVQQRQRQARARLAAVLAEIRPAGAA